MSRKSLPTLVLALLSTALVSIFIFQRSSGVDGRGWTTVIDSDGRGYYAFLPALLLFQDPSFDTCAALERKLIGNPDYVPEYLVDAGDQRVNKYFTGVALLQLPFFMVAACLSAITGAQVNGYSFWFQLSAGLGALFYLITGLWLLGKLLRAFTGNPWVIAFTLFAVTAGTNLLWYSVGQPLMSHVYSFFAITASLYFTTMWFLSNRKRWLFLSGLFLGLVILIRPVNVIIVILIPFLAGGWVPLRNGTAAFFKPGNFILFLAALLAILSVQPLAWFVQTGKWFLWPYGNEGFYFFRPAIWDVLFGFRKGLFIYTPLTLISLTGLIAFYKTDKFKFFNLFIFFILFIFVTSSWWNWYYGDGFGMRAMIDFYGLFSILLAVALRRTARATRAVLLAVSGLLILLNLVQTWQFSRGVIHPFNMDREKYGFVFLRTDPSLRDSIGGSEEIPWYGTRLEKACFAFSEKNVFIDSLSQYNTGPNLSASELPFIPGRYYAEGSFYVRDLSRGAGNSIMFVISIAGMDSARNYWYGFNINDIPYYDTVSWRAMHFSFNTPVIASRNAYIKTYLWNPSKKRLKVAYFSLVFYPVATDASRFQEYDSIGRHALLPPDESELFAGLGLDR
jgi:hypothetical protein